MADANSDLINLTADIVSAHVSNNSVATADVAALIRNVHDALAAAGAPPAPAEAKPEPAVAIRASVKPDYIVCLEDGKKMQMLKRYLRTHYNMTPDDYRSKWGLPRDYPMVAPAYAEKRAVLAKQIGLGRKPAEAVKAVAKRAVKSVSAGLEAARAHLGAGEAKAPIKRERKPKAVAPATEAPAAEPADA